MSYVQSFPFHKERTNFESCEAVGDSHSVAEEGLPLCGALICGSVVHPSLDTQTVPQMTSPVVVVVVVVVVTERSTYGAHEFHCCCSCDCCCSRTLFTGNRKPLEFCYFQTKTKTNQTNKTTTKQRANNILIFLMKVSFYFTTFCHASSIKNQHTKDVKHNPFTASNFS